jgi:hypothetical protein
MIRMIKGALSMSMSKRFANVLGLALVVFGPPAFAAISWTFSACANGGVGATCAVSSGGVTAIAQAWSNTKNNSANTVFDNSMETAYLRQYSGGLGVTNLDGATAASNCGTGKDCSEADSLAPEHAVDNNGRYDSILFTFSQAITLAQVVIGWPTSTPPNDSDISVLAYTGSGAPTLDGKTFANMMSITGGWKLAGNYADAANLSAVNVNGANGYTSQYWLLAAYNPNFGTTAGLDTGNDYVKFLTIAGNKPGRVPEPNVLLLFGIAAMAGFWNYRNRVRA